MLNNIKIIPGSSFIKGRDNLVKRVADSVHRNNAILLYGGRQAGKTSLLLKMEEDMSKLRGHVCSLANLDLPIYVDLMRLPYDAGPEDFFRLLASKAKDCCSKQIEGFTVLDPIPSIPNHAWLLDEFIAELGIIGQGCGEVAVRFLFLLDESQRILGGRFPRGFQDNLFSLLYGQPSADAPEITMVFAGGQHLYRFSEDETSPIGSRATSFCLQNLELASVIEILNLISSKDSKTEIIAESIHLMTGGQAGLVARLIEQISLSEDDGDMDKMLDEAKNLVFELNKGLFRNWTLSYTAEAATVRDILAKRGVLRLPDVAQVLFESKFDRFLAPRVCDELQYMGVAILHNGAIKPVNEMFWDYIKEFEVGVDATDINLPVWQLIETTELFLRQLIKTKFEENFGEQIDETVRGILGNAAWNEIKEMQKKALRKYRLSRETAERDIFTCLYIGQLIALMVNKKTWDLFKNMFRDKRALEDMGQAIMPVRNDRAHFASVPAKELERCRIACDDLLVCAERETEQQG